MKKLFFVSALAVSLCSFSALGDEITGYVSESHCGAAHNSPSDKNTQCINKCLQGGSDPVLVRNGKVMAFDEASKDKAKAFAGQNVRIDGTMNENVVTINSIDKAAQ